MQKLDAEDLLSKHGAGLLAERIIAYWAKRGFATVRAERYSITTNAWGVRSNLVSGWPPRRKWAFDRNG